MNAKDLRQRYASLMKELKAVPGVKVTDVYTRPGVSNADLVKWEAKAKCELPTPLKAYYEAINGHRIIWQKSTDEQQLMGRSTGISMPGCLSGQVAAYAQGELFGNTPFHPADLPKEQLAVLKHFMVFEQLYLDRFVLIDKTKMPGEVALYLYAWPFSLRRINLDFAQYLDKLFAHKAMLNWQEEYVAPEEQASAFLAQHRADQAALVGQLATTLPRKGTDYREHLLELLARLKSSKAIGPVKVERYPLPHLNELKRVERWLGAPLPQALLDFYSSLNGFRLFWSSKAAGDQAFLGQLDIAPILQAFGGDKAEQSLVWDAYATHGLLWNEELQKDEPDYVERIRHMRVFDKHLLRAQVLMTFADGQVDLSYWVDQGVTPLDVSFEQLVHGVFQTGGIEYYPALLAPAGRLALDRTEMEERTRSFNPNYALG